jgi:hypothetical protein
MGPQRAIDAGVDTLDTLADLQGNHRCVVWRRIGIMTTDADHVGNCAVRPR